MIDTLVSRHIDALSEWADHLRQRKTERGKSYRPNVAGARGRVQGAADNNNLRKQFTLSAKFKSWCVVLFLFPSRKQRISEQARRVLLLWVLVMTASPAGSKVAGSMFMPPPSPPRRRRPAHCPRCEPWGIGYRAGLFLHPPLPRRARVHSAAPK